MGQVLHGCATTTHAVRTAIQRSKAPLKELAARYGLNCPPSAPAREHAGLGRVARSRPFLERRPAIPAPLGRQPAQT